MADRNPDFKASWWRWNTRGVALGLPTALHNSSMDRGLAAAAASANCRRRLLPLQLSSMLCGKEMAERNLQLSSSYFTARYGIMYIQRKMYSNKLYKIITSAARSTVRTKVLPYKIEKEDTQN